MPGHHDELAIDFSNPAVKEYLALIRLQVLTPLSLLINIATLAVCSSFVKPSIGGLARIHPTTLSPNHGITFVYIAFIYLGQIGYCILLVLARKAETKKALTKGVGFALVAANWIMAAWAISFVFEQWLLTTICQGLLIVLLTYSNVALLVYHPPVRSRPLDTALIHAPMRFFLILPVMLGFAHCLFLTMDLTWNPNMHPEYYARNPWPGFGVLLGTNLLGLFIVLYRRDFVWTVAATWICVSEWSARPKATPVYILAILFTVLHPFALFTSFAYSHLTRNNRREGRIALPPDDQEQAIPEQGNGQAPREVDEDNLWG